MGHPSTEVRQRYEERRARYAGEWNELDRRSSGIAHLRFGLALVVIAGIVASLWGEGDPRPGWLIVAGAAMLGFIVSVRLHGRIQARQRRAAALRDQNEEGLARLDRAWERLPTPAPYDGEPGPLGDDLDLLGGASLRQLLGPAGTPGGDRTLTRWLLEPAPAGEIEARQGAVTDLAARLDLRQDLNRLGRRVSAAMPDVEPFLSWAEGAAWLASRPLLLWQARLLAVITTGALVGVIAGWLPPLVLVAPVALNLVLSWAVRRRTSAIFERVSLEPSPFPALGEQLAVLATAEFADPRLRELSGALVDGASSARARLDQLQRLTTLADVRHSGMVYALLQAVLQWDLNVLWMLERWQGRSGGAARGWLDQIGEVEALASLAGLAHDHPDWTLPTVTGPERPALRSQGLGHPLLPPLACVRNDLTLGPPGTFVLVTGSNMSGKSTLLRAAGLNAVLALAGGPVCAASLSLPVVALGTSFRVQDSLEQGLSYFMAELRRLKQVVDLAEANERPVLYLFDEILLGTNAEDRRIAVQKVLVRLLGLGAIGGVATHDLSLATAEGLADAGQVVHFTEAFEERDGRTEMTFDYTLRPGLSPTTNALKLLALVGLDDGG